MGQNHLFTANVLALTIHQESVCGKASWYGGDLPKLENYFIAMIIEDHDKLRQ